MQYKNLINDDNTKEQWTSSFTNELGRLAQGKNNDGSGSDTIQFITYNSIPIDRIKDTAYRNIVVNYKEHKEEPHRTRLTVGGNKINYHGIVSTPTAEITTIKLHLNSVISTKGAKYMTIDIKNFYLDTPMDTPEYIFLPKKIIPPLIYHTYELEKMVHNDRIYAQVNKGMYGLPQAGKLAHNQLTIHLNNNEYHQCKGSPGLWKHKWRPVTFTLVVDDFGVKYVGQEHAQHLINVLQKNYSKIVLDWTGQRYCGMQLQWDYQKKHVDISMPDFIPQALTKFQHKEPIRPQHSPFMCTIQKYSTNSQVAKQPDTSPELPKDQTKRIQQIIGTLLYYARVVDSTLLVALCTLAQHQSKCTTKTWDRINHLLDYCATHPNEIVRFKASDMILKVHSDASYLSKHGAKSRVGGHFFLGTKPTLQPQGNGEILNTSSILKVVVSSATEAEYEALFSNAKEMVCLRTTLMEMGHDQPPTIIITDNATAKGIACQELKQKHSKAMDMRFHWIQDRAQQQQLDIQWEPGILNQADYFTKHHPVQHHKHMHQFYLYSPD